MYQVRSGQEVCFGPSRPAPGRNARDEDGTRTGRDGPHLGTWMGPKHCKTKHMANLDGTTSDSGWDLDGPRIGPRRGSGWHPPEPVTDFYSRRLKCIQCSVGAWKCLKSLPPDPTPILDKIPGPMDARFLSSVGLGFGIRIGRSTTLPNTLTG